MSSMTVSTGGSAPVVDSKQHRGVSRPGGTRRGRVLRKLTPWLYLLIPLLLLGTFVYVPAANLFWYSTTNWDGHAPGKNYVGLNNYIRIFTDPKYFSVFVVSLYYIGASFVQIGLALYFATILSFKTRFREFFKGILFFPYLINGVAVAFIFLYLYKPDGTLNSFLALFGLNDPPQWLGDPHLANFSLAAVSIWRFLGLNFVLFLGAIQSIPSELYEAAELDGANGWHKFRYIIAPGIKRIISLSFVLAIAGSLAAFDVPYIMLQGANGTATFVIQTVQIGFGSLHKVGLASAMAVVLLVLVLIVTWVQRRLVPDKDVDLS